MSAKKYLEYAEECMEWAKSAPSDQERLIFIEMANTWLYAATMAGRSNSSAGIATSQMPPPLHAELS